MRKAFIFPGQGSQIVGMGKEFYDNFDIAKEVFEQVDEALNKKLSDIIFEGPQDLLTQTENAQPAIMCVSIAILKVLEKESGKKIEDLCEFVAGHSLGEYSALCASEAISLEDTARLLKVRGESFAVAGKDNPGAMATLLGATIEQAEDIANKARQDGEICQVANDNTVGQVVLSGHEKSINEAIKIATDIGIKRALKLQVSGAFHSKLMESAVENMKEILDNVTINTPKVPIVPNVIASNINNTNDIKKYLLEQITGKVRWRETMLFFQANGIEELVEVGHGKILTNMVGRTCENVKGFSINNLETLKEFISLK